MLLFLLKNVSFKYIVSTQITYNVNVFNFGEALFFNYTKQKNNFFFQTFQKNKNYLSIMYVGKLIITLNVLDLLFGILAVHALFLTSTSHDKEFGKHVLEENT